MFGPIFDWVLAAILGVVSVILLLGKGDVLLKSMNGKRRVANQKKTEEEKKKYSRAMGVFTAVLALDEVIVALYPNNSYVLLGSILVALAAIAGIGSYAKKFK